MKRGWMGAGVIAWAMISGLACSDLASGMKGVTAVRSDIRSALGVDSNVRFNTVNGVTSVSVTLSRLPADAATVKAKVVAIVKTDMPSATSVTVLAQL